MLVPFGHSMHGFARACLTGRVFVFASASSMRGGSSLQAQCVCVLPHEGCLAGR